MATAHEEYLALLDEVGKNLDQLTQLAGQKNQAVRKDDLLALDEVMKQEQAISLALRGLEQHRLKLLEQLGLKGVPLAGLAGKYPAELRAQAKQTVENLRSRYDIYRAASQSARTTLEINLHELEKIIAAHGGGPSSGAGYTPADVQPPSNMKTDFRA